VTPEQSFDIAERLRQAVAGRPFEHAGVSIDLTVSIGIALYPIHGVTADALIGEADRAMYAAKLEGRHGVYGNLEYPRT
jgi:diguanylate cyclase (GGDEF)-like protein